VSRFSALLNRADGAAKEHDNIAASVENVT
jgi:hypothetical protein